MVIIVVTGSRFATYQAHSAPIRRTLAWISKAHGDADPSYELWEGSASGVDVIARKVGTGLPPMGLGWGSRSFAANWPECDLDWVDPLTGTSCRSGKDHRSRRNGGVGEEYCPLAGFRRNQRMIDQACQVDDRKVCVAFPLIQKCRPGERFLRSSPGTADCLTRAWRAGIVTMVIPLDEPADTAMGSGTRS